MSRHRGAPVRPRYGRLAVLGSSLAVTLIAVLGGSGLLPSLVEGDAGEGGAAAAAGQVTEPSATPTSEALDVPAESRTSQTETDVQTEPVDDTALPEESGSGKRVVFSEGRQRVWLVDGKDVQRTYPVSGSIYDNLDPGTYEVYSRSEQAWGIDDSGTMKYFVRFTQGDNAAIGFHTIPVDDGKPVQTVAQLGTPLSHGCIRQRHADAVALWDFAPIGTTVVVTA